MIRSLRTAAKRYNFSAWLFLLPALFVFILTKYYPIVWGIYRSLFHYDIVNPPGQFAGLENYFKVFRDQAFYQDLGNMLGFFIVVMVLNFWPPILIALLVNELRGNKTLFRSLYFIPAIAPSIAIMFIWKYVWQPDYGLANYLLGLLHLPNDFMWLNSDVMVKWCLYFPFLIMCGGINFVIYLAALQDVPQELYEACMMDGGSVVRRIRHITIPVIMPVVEVMFVLAIIGVVNLFTEPYVMTGGGPGGASETLSILAYKKATKDLEYSYSMAISTITFIICFIFTVIQMKLSSRKE